MRLIIEIDKELDPESAATVLEEVGRCVRTQELDEVELMDGSFRIPTTHGTAFLSVSVEEDEEADEE